MVSLFNFKIVIETSFSSTLVQVGAIIGNPRPVFDEGVWTAAVPTATNNFVPFDQLPNLEVDSIIGKLSRCTIIYIFPI
jgi:hypothetical protein